MFDTDAYPIGMTGGIGSILPWRGNQPTYLTKPDLSDAEAAASSRWFAV
jgi:hypothetical protein